MKKDRFVLVYAIAGMLFFIIAAYMSVTSKTDVSMNDYSGLLRIQAVKEAPETAPLPKVDDAGFKDKSFATGVDSSPTLSVG